MNEKRNNRTVERKLKDALKNDRARIQVGRISHFGLLEMSRQRIRTGVLESSTEVCPHCGGTGHVRSVSSVALHLLRSIEDNLLRSGLYNLVIRARPEAALYVLNHKRANLAELEARFRVLIEVVSDVTVSGQHMFAIERGLQVHTFETAYKPPATPAFVADEPEDDIIEEIEEEEDAASEEAERPARDDAEENERRKRRRRRRRRGSRRDNEGENGENGADETDDGEAEGSDDAEGNEAGSYANGDKDDKDEDRDQRRRRRGRRGGRRNKFRDGETGERAESADGSESDEPQEGEAQTAAVEPVADEAVVEAAVTEADAVEPVETEKPKRAKRPSRAKAAKEPEAAVEAPAAAPVAAAPLVASVQEPEDDKKARRRLPDTAIEELLPKPDEAKPRRFGWWSKKA